MTFTPTQKELFNKNIEALGNSTYSFKIFVKEFFLGRGEGHWKSPCVKAS
ncbi:hypothetical protein, partial [Campylobacter jejuni]